MFKSISFLVVSVFLVSGCSILGVKPDRAEKVSKYVRGYVCDLPEAARAIMRMDLEKQGITLKVDCDYESTL